MKNTQTNKNAFSMKKALSKIALVSLINNLNPFDHQSMLVKADQPVHCLREQMYGVWNFHVSSDKNKVNLFETKELCTHNVPNRVQVMNNQHHF